MVRSVGATKNVTRNVTRGARTAATRPNIGAGINVFIRGTHYSRHTFREQPRLVARVQKLLFSRARGASGVTRWQGSTSMGKNTENSTCQPAVSYLPTLTFFFAAAYTSSTRRTRVHERRTGGQVRRDGL